MGREQRGKGEGNEKSTNGGKSSNYILKFFGMGPQQKGGRIRSIGKCRFAGSQRLLAKRSHRPPTCSVKKHGSYSFINEFESRVNERQTSSRYVPPQRTRYCKMSAAFVVVVCLFLLLHRPAKPPRCPRGRRRTPSSRTRSSTWSRQAGR